VAASLAVPSLGFAQQQIVLANGDRLSGELAGIEDSQWIFSYQGQKIAVPAEEVRAFTAPERIGIRLADTTVVAATVRPVPGGLLLELEDGTSRIVQPGDLAAVGPADDLGSLEPIIIGLYRPFLKFWSALASLGGSFQRGNTDENNFSFSLDVGRETSRDRIDFGAIITTSTELDDAGGTLSTEPKIIVGLGTDIFFSDRLFGNASMRWQHDPKKDLQFRQTYSGGIGYQIVQTDATGLQASVGAGGRFDNLTTGLKDSTPILDIGARFRQFVGPFIFRVRVTYNPSLEDFSNVELLDAYDVAIRLVKGLTFKWTLLHEYNNPPPAGNERSDITMTYQLGYALGVK
jgi:hypothetical protein